jgi:hypothetical protein
MGSALSIFKCLKQRDKPMVKDRKPRIDSGNCEVRHIDPIKYGLINAHVEPIDSGIEVARSELRTQLENTIEDFVGIPTAAGRILCCECNLEYSKRRSMCPNPQCRHCKCWLCKEVVEFFHAL